MRLADGRPTIRIVDSHADAGCASVAVDVRPARCRSEPASDGQSDAGAVGGFAFGAPALEVHAEAAAEGEAAAEAVFAPVVGHPEAAPRGEQAAVQPEAVAELGVEAYRRGGSVRPLRVLPGQAPVPQPVHAAVVLA